MNEVKKEYKEYLKEKLKLIHSEEAAETPLATDYTLEYYEEELNRFYYLYERKEVELTRLGYGMEEKRECYICRKEYYTALEFDFLYAGHGFGCFKKNHMPCHSCFCQCHSCPICRNDKVDSDFILSCAQYNN